MNIPTLVNTDNICLFCGNEMPRSYEERTPYFECYCADAVKDGNISKQIMALTDSRPKARYDVTTKLVLIKIEDNEKEN